MDFHVILNLQMNCCGHNSLHILGHSVLFQMVLWDLWCESELENQLSLLNQFKIRLLPQCPLKCINSVPHPFFYCADISVSRNTEISPSSPWCCQGWVLWCIGWWGLLGTSQAVQHQTDAGLWCLEQTIPADHSCSSTAPPCTDELGAHPSAFPEGFLWLLLPLNLRTGQM